MLYFEPNFIDEALVLLDRFAPDARVLAGGSILGTRVRANPALASAIVNVKRIPQLSEIEFDGHALRVGALVTARELSDDSLVRSYAPLLAAAAGSLGARQLRNVATLGGNLCSGHHAADLAVALLASDARVLVAHIVDGPTEMPLLEFLAWHAAPPDSRSLVTAVEIPGTRTHTAFVKMQTRRAFELALVSVAVAVEIDSGNVTRARIALGGAAALPMRAAHAEDALRGSPLTPAAAHAAALIAAERDAGPHDDDRASAQYRRHLVAVLTERALAAAAPPAKAAG